MNKEELAKYIESPNILNKESLDLFNKLVVEFPYFQTARLLLLKNLQNVNSSFAKSELKKAATFISNRKKLFLLLKDKIEEKEEIISDPNLQKEEIITETANDKQQPDDKKEALSDIIAKRMNEINEKDETSTIDSGTDQRITKEKSFEHIADTILRKAAEQKINKKDQEEVISENINLQETQKTNPDTDLLIIDDNESISKDHKAEEDSEIKTETYVSEKENKELLLLESSEEIVSTTHYDKSMNLLFSHKVNLLDLKLPSEIFSEEEEIPEGDDLIGKFIKDSPTFSRNLESEYVVEHEDISTHSVQENEEYLTDTLVDIYIKQGYYTKAILAYEKLSLKYPEKSSYFAKQIEKIKKFNNKS